MNLALHLFIPCFMDQFAPRVAESVVELLERLGTPWHYPPEQTCCGQFALTLGDLATARKLMRHFLRVFGDAPAILCPSASCTLMVRHHYPQLAENFRERREVEALAARTWELSEWLRAQGPLPWAPRFAGTLALHHSCKARQLGVLPGAGELLSQVAGLELLAPPPYFSCCGFGGAFKVQHPDLSRAIGGAYLEAVQASGAAGLVSLDYSCLLHLSGINTSRGQGLKLLYLTEVLLGE